MTRLTAPGRARRFVAKSPREKDRRFWSRIRSLAGESQAFYVLATLAVFATGWGWPGLIHYATVRSHRETSAAASGFVLSWIYVGNVVGPAIVGFVAEHRSYAEAWAYGAVVLALAAGATLVARRLAVARALA